jgi:hypothetical protein
MHPNLRSLCSLGIVSFFVFFLASSAPHRVHHFFDDLPNSHKEISKHDADARYSETIDGQGFSEHSHDAPPDHDNHKGKPRVPDCVAASVAQNAHLSIVEVPDIAVRVAEFRGQAILPVLSFVTFNPAPFGERAPPLV